VSGSSGTANIDNPPPGGIDEDPELNFSAPRRPDGATLTGLSVAYKNSIQAKPVGMTRKARAAARQDLKPFGMSPNKKKIRPVDPAQNNPNDIGSIIIPQGTGPM
jgi:hypothetical protein